MKKRFTIFGTAFLIGAAITIAAAEAHVELVRIIGSEATGVSVAAAAGLAVIGAGILAAFLE